MWAVVRIVGQLALFDERGHLLRGQTVVGADGGVTGSANAANGSVD
jgi:hypothetical protein